MKKAGWGGEKSRQGLKKKVGGQKNGWGVKKTGYPYHHCYHCRICERHALIPAVESCRRRMLDFTKNRYQISAGRCQVGVFSSGCTTSLRTLRMSFDS